MVSDSIPVHVLERGGGRKREAHVAVSVSCWFSYLGIYPREKCDH